MRRGVDLRRRPAAPGRTRPQWPSRPAPASNRRNLAFSASPQEPTMIRETRSTSPRRPLGAALLFAAVTLGSYASLAAGADLRIALAGDREVPPVKTAGYGT